VACFRGPVAAPDEQLRWLWPAAHVAMALWDDESYEVLSARHIEIGREAGVLAVMPTALTTRIVSCAFFGQLTDLPSTPRGSGHRAGHRGDARR
jgi:hypothetical protein